MARPFVLPDLGEGLTEAEIVTVLVAEGDLIREDAPFLEVETDKAQVEIPSPMAGRIEKIHVQPGQTVRVGEVLVTFADADEVAARPPQAPPAPGLGPTGAATREAAAAPAHDGAPVPATPATRRLARELGVDLRGVRGTGAGGRVTDVEVRAAAGGEASGDGESPSGARRRAAAGSGPLPAPARPAAKPLATVGLEPPPLPAFEQWGPVERAPLSHLRRTIADRMTLSATLVPHVTHFDRADITELDALIRRNLEAAREQGVTLTLTGFLLEATALALRAHPQFNASLDAAAGELILKRYYHLGVAVATERGLIVPVLRDVDRKRVMEIARELGALAQRGRDGKATIEDLRGGTFTISNIGALGGTGAIPIINYPEVAILGVARAREEAVVREGQIVPRLMLPLSLTFDHRVADGADGARFASDIVRRLEHPDQLLLGL
ncbi:MAG: dihydrolipoamide acetyltransferase family protein [Candidatus Rokubacteria bacterium]|nr:dihydrolipoamide acetyltransferase family protein [Candidatus Rokubacteria bacterium]